MKNEKGVSTRLWIEKLTNQTDAKKSGAVSYTSKKFELDKALVKRINQYLKKEKISWETLLSATVGLLLGRLSSTRSVHYRVGESDGGTVKNMGGTRKRSVPKPKS